ncbi:TetR/AcrR family transcriptional regulator [Aquabacterium sp.]|uniref:TetR/AcrR family transcriptional regulator n=1 Tax=Aquabacterium sp. TaxID=1872578 RepID=UPI002CF66B67|nr:TetR family transcriptional regulator [Aquabacterium sp.]HSW06156.1 TetR family transcriptional regulator [Aquabacterium sp.]
MSSAANEASTTASTPRFQEKREAVLAAAARHFNQQGVKGATLADIAASVGLVTTSVTYYYRKKEDLATACFLRAIAAHEALVDEAARAPTVALRLAALFRGHAEALAAMDAGTRPPLILFNDIRALPEPQQSQVFEAYTNLFRRVRGLFTGPESAGWTREQLNARTHLLVSVAHWVRSWIHRFELDDYPRAAARVTDILLRGVAVAGAAWPAPAALDQALLLVTPDSTEEAFLRAATELVNEQGYRGASVDKISARLNVTKGSFYHHNDNKRDLISACFERSFSLLRRVLAAAESAAGPGWERTCAGAAAVLRYQLSEHGPLLRSTATSALPDQAHREQVRRTMLRLIERITSVLVDGMMDGSVRPLDPAIAAQVLFAQINAASELRRWVPSARVDNVAALYLRPGLLGLLCEP